MNTSHWRGVFAAMTTPFQPDGAVDLNFLSRHAAWLIEHGCAGLVMLGSLGEGGTLTPDERRAVLREAAKAAAGRVPIISGVAALSTDEAVRQAQHARAEGCLGLMVLPPYVYRGSWRELRSHLACVMHATDLSCMLYNNPIAYGVDILPEQVAELAAAHPNLHAVKESSADVRRITALRALLGDRLATFVGVDDLIVEGIHAGAVGWIAGLVNALPRESVRLFDLARAGNHAQAAALYDWFLPLLRLDVVPQFVHLIKLVQMEVGMGSTAVRPPRLQLAGPELDRALATIRHSLATRPRP